MKDNIHVDWLSPLILFSGSQGSVDVVRGGMDLRPGVHGRHLALDCQISRSLEQGGAGGGQGGARPLQGDLEHPLLLQSPPNGKKKPSLTDIGKAMLVHKEWICTYYLSLAKLILLIT